MDTVNLTHHFLIAMPGMVDPNFNGTLTYICDHSDQGALGVVVNRPIDLDLSTLFEQIGLSLPETIILRKVLRPQLIAVFVGVVAMGILVVGYVFNFIL